MKEAYIIFECVGDLRKNLFATAVVSSIKKAHPDRNIVVVTNTPEVWLHNPSVYRCYGFGRMSYFYDDYVKDKDTIIMRHDPFTTEDFTYGRKHILEIWCNLCGVEYDQSLPSLYFTWREKEAVGKLTASTKPLFFIQTTNVWTNDIPRAVAQKIVDIMNERGYATIHLRTGDQIALQGTLALTFDARLTLCALSRSDKRLLTDSYAMQVATAFNLPSVVLWVTGNPLVTGYKMHTNVIAKPDPLLKESIDNFNESFVFGNAQLKSPPNLDKIFNIDEIISLLI